MLSEKNDLRYVLNIFVCKFSYLMELPFDQWLLKSQVLLDFYAFFLYFYCFDSKQEKLASYLVLLCLFCGLEVIAIDIRYPSYHGVSLLCGCKGRNTSQ